jgi:hypothetical protein
MRALALSPSSRSKFTTLSASESMPMEQLDITWTLV